MKSYTDIEQSKVLAKILPLESADMYYMYLGAKDKEYQDFAICAPAMERDLCAWSLAALLGVLPNENMLVKTTNSEYYCIAKDVTTKHYNNPIDACYELILKLQELKML